MESLMEILVTGSNGFIGRNLIAHLKQHGYTHILPYDRETDPGLLDVYTARCDFVFHLAGVNRPEDGAEFTRGNEEFTKTLLKSLEHHNNQAPVLASSSTQAVLDNPYGQSKKAMEELVLSHKRRLGGAVFLYRLPGVFGKWCRPNYNSVVATFCHHIARGIPITVNDRETVLPLAYIDDLAEEWIRVLEGKAASEEGFCSIPTIYTVSLGQIADLLQGFRDSRRKLSLLDLSDAFARKLYSTYMSYLPAQEFACSLQTHTDNRGSFTEFLRLPGGQVSVNISKPGVIKGNHWHHSKNEKFLAVSGEGVFRFRAVDSEEVITISVKGEELRVVDVPPGYAHSIENTGSRDLVTIIWASECFDKEKPDTYALEVSV